MDFYEAVESRHSIRAFTGEPVSRAVIERCMAAAAQAPSSLNLQPWRFHVATGATREAVGHAMAQSTLHLQDYIGIIDAEHLQFAERFYADLGNAPMVIAVSAPPAEDELTRINTLVAVGCAMENLLLAVTAEGLGACSLTFSFWVRDELAQAYGLTDDREVVALLLVGHPSESPVAPPHNLDVATYHD
jgi:nitroreductase